MSSVPYNCIPFFDRQYPVLKKAYLCHFCSFNLW